MEMFKSRAGIDMQHMPYKGTAGALQDTVGGRINVMFDVVGPLMPQVKAGNVKALVVTAKERIPAAARRADHGGAGRAGLRLRHLGRHRRAGRHAEGDRRARLGRGAEGDARSRPCSEKLAEQGIVAVGNTPDEYRAFVVEEIARWAKVIKDAEHQDGGVSSAVIPGRAQREPGIQEHLSADRGHGSRARAVARPG